MPKTLVLAMLLLSIPDLAVADTLRMRDGEKRTGKVLAETDSEVLFRRDDGVVSRVPRSDISIIDVDPGSSNLKGSVGFYTETPKKKREDGAKKKKPFDFLKADDAAEKKAPPPGESALQKQMKEWVKDRPDMLKIIEQAEQGVLDSNERLEKMEKMVAELENTR